MPTGRVTTSGELANSVVQLQRIMVATDFSDGARAALDYALGIASRFQSKIFLVHVIPVLPYVSPESSEEAIQQARKFAAREMRRLVEASDYSGMLHLEILSGGRVWPLLEEYAKRQTIDLMVMGTRGHNTGNSQLLGPVAEEIFRLAGCPILTVGARAECPAIAASGVKRILYATNFKPHSERAGFFAHILEREHGAKMTVLHVVEEQLQSREGSQSIVRDFMLRRLRKGLPVACVGKCEPEFEVRFGDPGEQILSLAREQHSDLIILGLRAGIAADGHLPSATAYKIVCQASCPVLTMRL
jgi:nucleotide-binding universal stress UspA family protein